MSLQEIKDAVTAKIDEAFALGAAAQTEPMFTQAQLDQAVADAKALVKSQAKALYAQKQADEAVIEGGFDAAIDAL